MTQKANSLNKSVLQLKNWHCYGLIVIFSFIFYGNTVQNKYAMDDDLVTTTYEYLGDSDNEKDLISRHPNVEKGIKGIPKIFTSHFAVNKKQSYSYRPVVTSVFAIEYQFFGSNPYASHFFNILFYALVVFLIFRFIRLAWPEMDIGFAALVALLFLIHPLHSEVVNNVKSRDELLCLSFGLGAIIQLLKYLDTRKWWNFLSALLLVLCALLCKKTGIVFIPIALLTAVYVRRINWKHFFIFIGSLVFAFVAFKLIKSGFIDKAVSREMQFFENPLYFSDSIMDRIPMYFYSNFYYLKLLIAPYPLRYYYGFDQVQIATWSNPITWFMCFAMVASVVFIIWRFKKREIWAFGTLFFLLGIGGACNLLFPAVGIIAERFAFVASLGFCLVVAYGFHRIWKSGIKWQVLGVKILLALILIGSLITVLQRNPAWASRKSLYETDMINLDSSAKAHSLLAQYYAGNVRKMQAKISNNQGPNSAQIEALNTKLNEAIYHFTICTEIDSNYAVSFNNLGAMYFLYKGNVDSARINFRRALVLDSNYVEANFNVGNTYLEEYKIIYPLYDLTNGIRDTLSYSSTKPIDFFAKNKGMFIAYSRFKNGLQSKLIALAKSATDTQSFITQLTQSMDRVIDQGGLQSFYSSSNLNERLNEELDTFKTFNSANQLLSYVTNVINENMRNSFYNSVIKGNFNLREFRYHLNNELNGLENKLVKHMSVAIQLDSAYSPAYDKLSDFFITYGKLDECIVLNNRGLQSNAFQDSYQFHINIGNANLMKNKIKNAIPAFELAIVGLQEHLVRVRKDKSLKRKLKMIQSENLKARIVEICTSLINLCQGKGDLLTAEKYINLKSKI
ncbi:glycosyltransferase family 39 protein [Flavobacteriales bacterium]|nr:glycosyltransferase family 39 protein [Flavobacteriales bacterium]MDC3336718.1 glycosyltransferase family 39 protein [Flavobacteriales bacterium]